MRKRFEGATPELHRKHGHELAEPAVDRPLRRFTKTDALYLLTIQKPIGWRDHRRTSPQPHQPQHHWQYTHTLARMPRKTMCWRWLRSAFRFELPTEVLEAIHDCFGEVLVFEHIGARFCGGDAAVTNALLDWVAHMLQHPEQKPATALALVSGPRTGSSSLVRLVSRLIGERTLIQTHNIKALMRREDLDPPGALVHLGEFQWNTRSISHVKRLIEAEAVETRNRHPYARRVNARVVITSHENPTRCADDFASSSRSCN